MSETPTQRADRVDRMLENCRNRKYVSLSRLESVRNDLRAVANEYEDLEAQLKLQAGALPLDPRRVPAELYHLCVAANLQFKALDATLNRIAEVLGYERKEI